MSVVRTRRKSGPECVRCGKRIWKDHFCFQYDIRRFAAATREAKRLSAYPQKRCTQCRKVMRVSFNADTDEIEHYGHVNGGNFFCSLRCGMTYAVKTVQRLNADQLRD